MRITIKNTKRSIPHIINGSSANTLFFLINYTRLRNKKFDGEYNHTSPSLPYDINDFSRIMNACNCFGWKENDIEVARINAEKLEFGKKYLMFLDNFFVLKSFYNDGEDGDNDLKQLLDEINYGTSNEETEDEFNVKIIGEL